MTLVQDPLEQVLTAIQQRWGSDALRPLGELSTQQITLPTGFTALDELVGGWPRGRLSLVTGGPTAGLTTLGLYALAAAQREDRPALIVDVGRTLDPASAVHCGVDLEQVLLVHPAAGTLGLSLVRDVVACQPVGCSPTADPHAHSQSADVGERTAANTLGGAVSGSIFGPLRTSGGLLCRTAPARRARSMAAGWARHHRLCSARDGSPASVRAAGSVFPANAVFQWVTA